MGNLDFLFNPKSVAIVGISEDPTKLGSVLFSNLLKAGYKGNIYPVNPKHTELYGVKCYEKVSVISEDVDLVCIVVPAKFVKEVIEDSALKKVKGAVIISAGFKEIGDEGIEMEKEIMQIANENGIRILGPNCLGAIVPGNNVNVSFAASEPVNGNIAFLSQSGAVCTAMLDMALEKNLGFSHFVSFGNKADISENDLIDEWLKDENVKVIGGYIEEIKSGHELTKMYYESKGNKPLVILKPGETREAQQAIASHTGSMAGSSQTFKTAMQQSGIIVANEINQMFNYMMAFSWSVLPKGNRIAVITNAGGPGIIATDLIMEHGLKMAEISDSTKEKMKPFLPSTSSLHNPIDVIGDALAERYKVPIDILLQDENVDAILVILTPQLVTQIEDTAKLIINSAKLAKKPIYPVFLGGKYVSFGLQRLFDEKIPAFKYINDAVEVISAMYDYNIFKNKDFDQIKTIEEGLMDFACTGKYHDEIRDITKEYTQALAEVTVAKIAEEVGLELPKQIIAESFDEALSFAEQHYPVVIKATTDVIAHKTDQKAVYLDIMNTSDFGKAYAELESLIKNEFKVQEPKILVQEQIKNAEEIFIGANRDGSSNVYSNGAPGFGHVLAFGKGGIYTEVYKDINYVLVPVLQDAIEMSLSKTHVSKILDGFRNIRPLAKDKLINAIEAVQKMVLLYPEIESLDINPILLTQDRAVAVDIKIFLKK